jgi:hypothetical protein
MNNVLTIPGRIYTMDFQQGREDTVHTWHDMPFSISQTEPKKTQTQ